ncbi:GGDEF domain-containing protein [Xanthobacter sediminis]|uniref:GGDEF domain-containing protein n=1 Tax=Xanthobacter sediminis TaxID=3119926 RepID=UPI0037299060
MRLDFQTLYLIILLNSLCYCVIWAGFAYMHRDIPGARWWLGAAVMTTLGGLLMSGDGTPWGRAFMILGNAVVVAGFVLVWQGIREFYGRGPRLRIGAVIVAVAVAAGFLAGDTRAGQNVAYAGTQLVPLALSFLALCRWGRGALGAKVAAAGILIAIAGQATEAGLNILRLLGRLSTEGYYTVAAYLLVTVIVGAGLWYLGFLLMAVDRLRLKLARLATSDHLTGLPNRRHFLEAAQEAFVRTRAEQQTLAMLLIDLDNFKGINDQLGHAAGDACLRHFSALCAVCAGPRGLPARFGGDEFAMLIEGPHPGEAAEVAGRLVRVVAEAPLQWRGHAICLTTSVGVAMADGTGPGTLDLLIEAADRALYATKRSGRNGFTLASGALAAAPAGA